MPRTRPSGPVRHYLDRFSRAERAVHWITAALMIICIVTAAVLYNGSLSIKVGHRHVVELVHVYAGFALPAPMLFGLVSAAYRADLARLNRFSPSDWRWMRSRTRRDGSIRVGKFNAIDPHVRERHHDAIEFPDGSYVLVTQLCEGQRVTVLQLPVVQTAAERAAKVTETPPPVSIIIG
jgi:hypothetical protein